MSSDLRHKFAYFGPREKLYKNGKNTEILGLPYNWRRILSTCHPSTVVGPFGCLYADVEHAICAYRYLYTSNRPIYANIFRSEVDKMQGAYACKRWGSSNGMSLLMSDPNDRLWYLIRDQCMYELIYQRIARDEEYRFILNTLYDNQFLPVYHIRTSVESTYWGATINRKLVSNSMIDRCPKDCDEELYEGAEKNLHRNIKDCLIGQNRLGEIMVDALQAYRQLYLLKKDETSCTGLERIYDLLQFRFDYSITPIAKTFCTEKESTENNCGVKRKQETEKIEEKKQCVRNEFSYFSSCNEILSSSDDSIDDINNITNYREIYTEDDVDAVLYDMWKTPIFVHHHKKL